MLLHNQRGAEISWEDFSWAPYGACDVPDELVPLIKSTGFPVGVAPVPPKEKAARAAAEGTSNRAVVPAPGSPRAPANRSAPAWLISAAVHAVVMITCSLVVLITSEPQVEPPPLRAVEIELQPEPSLPATSV